MVSENEPIPEPIIRLFDEIVGLGVVDQQRPLLVTLLPPSFVTLPPIIIELYVIFVAGDVETVGGPARTSIETVQVAFGALQG